MTPPHFQPPALYRNFFFFKSNLVWPSCWVATYCFMNCFWAGQVWGNLGSHKEYAVCPWQFHTQSFSASSRLLILTTQYVVMEFMYVLPGFDTASGHLILMLSSAVRNRVKYLNFYECHLKSWLSPGSSFTSWSLSPQLPFLFFSFWENLEKCSQSWPLDLYSRLTLNLWSSSCLSFPGVGIRGVYQHSWLTSLHSPW